MKISLIIPAYNEEERISAVLAGFTRLFKQKETEFELIVVCEGTDKTADIAAGFKDDGVKTLKSRVRLGKGGAIIKGFKEATGDAVGFADCDLSVSPEDVWRLFTSLDESDCVIGSRRVQGSEITVSQPFMRRFSSRAFNLYVRLLFGLPIRDTQCGAKVFRRAIIEAVLPKLTSRGFEFDVELLWRIKQAGYSIREAPVEWKHEQGSKFSLIHGPGMLLSLLRLRLGF